MGCGILWSFTLKGCHNLKEITQPQIGSMWLSGNVWRDGGTSLLGAILLF